MKKNKKSKKSNHQKSAKPNLLIELKSEKYINIVLICLLIACVYAVWIGNDFIYDDIYLFVRHQGIQSVQDFIQIFKEPHLEGFTYYRPVVRTTFLLQKTIHGNRPVMFHLFNIVVITSSALLIYFILRLPVFNIPKSLAALTAGLFGLHPTASSCVFPVASGRETSVLGFFMLITFYAFLRKGKRWYWISVIMFFLAMLSKEQAVTILPLLILADLFKLTSNHSSRKIILWLKRYTPYIFIFIFYFGIRYLLFHGSEWKVKLFEHPENVLLVPFFAIQSIFTPFVKLHYEPQSVSEWFSLSHFMFALIITGIIIYFLIKNKNIPKGKLYFWITWFFVSQIPTFNILYQEVPFSERYIYMALASVLCFVTVLLEPLWKKTNPRKIILTTGVLFLIVLSILTGNRGRFFKNNTVFYSQWMKTSPDYFLTYSAMGSHLLVEGNNDEAVQYLEKALILNPDWHYTRVNLGIAYLEKGEYQKALKHLYAYRKLMPDKPDAYYQIGGVYSRMYQFSQAMHFYNKTLDLKPDHARALGNMGYIYHRLGDFKNAYDYYNHSLKLDPTLINMRKNLDVLIKENPDFVRE
jgi:hypothetical protein